VRQGGPALPAQSPARVGHLSPRIPEELRTERLLLRRWRPDDPEALATIYTDPDYLEHMRPLDLEQTRAQIERLDRTWSTEGYGQWAAEDLADGTLAGRIGLLCHRDWPLVDGPVPEVGWVLRRDLWGRGLATEGGRAAIECWREDLDDPRLISITSPANRRSRAVMERLGLKYRGEARWHDHDVVWYALDRA
jgi:RimJ/RimL family protein N-acetyltransferase